MPPPTHQPPCSGARNCFPLDECADPSVLGGQHAVHGGSVALPAARGLLTESRCAAGEGT